MLCRSARCSARAAACGLNCPVAASATRAFRNNALQMRNWLVAALVTSLLTGCGRLERNAALINVGDTKQQVLAELGTPDDRQLKGQSEAWQYCQTTTDSFGYHDYRIVWFERGTVTGINSYRSSASCVSDLQPIKWENAPNATVEIRNR